MTSSLSRNLALATLAVAGLLLTSCIENSTVIRVAKDGSGEIFARYYFSPQVSGMLGMMNGFAAQLSGTEGAAGSTAPAPSPEELLKPDQAALEADAAAYGKGVSYERHEYGKNANGWEGYLVVYRFEDINQLSFNPTEPPGPFDDLAKSNPAAAAAIEEQTAGKEVESPVKFTMADGVLTIDTGVSPDTLNEIGEAGGSLGGGGGLPGGGAIEGPNGAQIDPAMAMQMAAGMFQGMRIAYFLRIDGEIAETNATYVDDTLITMSDMQPGKMMTDPAFTELVKEAQAVQANGQQPDEAQVKAMMEKVKGIEGLKIETQEQVTVRFK